MLPRNDHLAVLRLFAVYAGVVAAVCLALAPSRPLPFLALGAVHVLAAAALLRASRADPPDPHDRRHLLLPYVLWLASWLVLGRIFVLGDRLPHDVPVAAWDLALFGGPWHLRLGEVLPGAGVAQALQFFYVSYYGIVVGPPLVFALRGRVARCERYTLLLMATYLACFVVYLVFPVVGPRAISEAAAADPSAPAGGLAGFAAVLRHVGDSQGTAFPSSHCAASLAAALGAGAGARRWLQSGLVAWALLIALATVHTGNHYALDSVAGILLALGLRRTLR